MVATVALVAVPSQFTIGQIPEQKTVNGRSFPLVINPNSNFANNNQSPNSPSPNKSPDKSNPNPSIEAVVHALAENRDWVETKLAEHGALLLRGFSAIEKASDFNAVVEACNWLELPYVGGAAPRTNVVGRVFTSNESPPDQKIPFHHEMAQVPEFPSKIFFFCEVKPAKGGETPIVLSHSVYSRMHSAYPDFVEKLEKHGLFYIRIMGEGDDPSSPIGRGWQSTFLTKDKSEAEKRAAKLGMKLEWLGNGNVKTISGPLPAIKLDEKRGQKVWFNSMVAAYTGWDDVRNDPKRAVILGDGSLLPEEAILGCLSILHEESVAIPWQPGDVFILDNIAVQHARTPFEPPRRVLASLCK